MSQMPNWGKGMLFLSSFSPLYIVVAFKSYDVEYSLFGYPVPSLQLGGFSLSFLAVACILLLVVSLLFLGFVLRITRSEEGQLETAEVCENRNDLVAEYLTVYIFPLAVLNYSDLADIAIFATLFVAIGAIQIRSTRLYINPVLAASGFTIYKARIKGEDRLILSKEKLKRSDALVKSTELSNGVYVTTT